MEWLISVECFPNKANSIFLAFTGVPFHLAENSHGSFQSNGRSPVFVCIFH